MKRLKDYYQTIYVNIVLYFILVKALTATEVHHLY